jgi:hypothetical protein
MLPVSMTISPRPALLAWSASYDHLREVDG